MDYTDYGATGIREPETYQDKIAKIMKLQIDLDTKDINTKELKRYGLNNTIGDFIIYRAIINAIELDDTEAIATLLKLIADYNR